MPRVSLVEEKDHPELAALVERIRGGRGGRLLDIYGILLHSPALAEGWLDIVGAVRWKTDIDGALREIVMLRVGMLNGADYVFDAHVPRYTQKEGLTREKCMAVADWRNSPLFDERERAALAYTDAMTRDIRVPESLTGEVLRHYSERQLVELTVLVGTYNMHTRVLLAFGIESEMGSR
jgi:4-carboxymuconolactone decarboxylase